MLSLNVSTESLVCRPCRDDITRVLANPAYIPRWKKGEVEICNRYCCVKNCNSISFTQTNMCSSSNELKCIDGIEFTTECIPIPTPLCKNHYHVVYDALQSRRKHCITCGRRLHPGSDRRCPQPHIIQMHLTQHTDFEGSILRDDRVCLTCYKSHLVILKENRPVSTDEDLKVLIDTLGVQTGAINSSTQDIIFAATTRMLTIVGKMLMENRAMLLPTIQSDFIKGARDLIAAKGMQEPQELKSLSSRCILSEITAKYQHHVTYTCKVRKHGTLVYRPNSDILSLLSEAMWKLKQTHVEPVTNDVLNTCENTDTCDIGHVNKLIHAQIESYLSANAEAPLDYDDLHLDEHIAKIDPQLWNAMCVLTRSKSESRGTSKVNDHHSTAHHVKKIRRFFILCTILFSTDDRCSIPMHTLITDLIESQGGSSVLVRILNRLGVCSSADTLARFVQFKRNTSDQHHFKHLSKDAFTVVSADNLDFMHSFARVFGGHQTSSWHGTTVQVAQPLPSLSVAEEVHITGTSPATSVDDLNHGYAVSLPDTLLHVGVPTRGDALSPPDTLLHVGVPTRGDALSPPDTLLHVGVPTRGDDVSLTDTSLGTVTQSHEHTVSYIGTCVNDPSCNVHVSRKRVERSSPFPSPMKATRSPLAKTLRRERTGTEGKGPQEKTHVPELSYRPNHHSTQLALSDFLCSVTEKTLEMDLQREMNAYMVHRVAACNSTFQHPFLNLQDYYSLTRPTHTEPSQVIYLEVLDAVADCKDTMMILLHSLRSRFIEERNMRWLVLEGDAKLYEILKNLTFEYGDELSWLIPYPGDFHMLMNYQKALMKPYYDAGLKALAQASGYPLPAIQSCSQFKRTHHFLLEAWEAVYRVMILEFEQTHPSCLHTDITTEIQSMSTANFSNVFNHHLHSRNPMLQEYFDKFLLFIQKMARTDETWRFWVQFIFEDAMAYISLFIAIRSGDWELRVASIKSMAALFTAFDHPTYQKLISRHLEDIVKMPAPITAMFRQGAFVVSVSGRPWHSVAIDESHEMLINKDCKTSIVHPLPDYINRIAQHIPYRSKAIKNLQNELFPTRIQKKEITGPFSTQPNDLKCEQNICSQVRVLQEAGMLSATESNRGLLNYFTGKEANPAQQNDLLNFRLIGQQEFLQRISSVILKNPSVHAPNRRRRLQTFSERKVTKSRVTQLEKDKKLIITAMKKKMQFSRRTGRPVERPGEQLIELPLALCDSTGNPLKGQKSYTTHYLQCRYKETIPHVFLTNMPWKPECCVLEGMFLINTTPLGSHKIMSEYAKFLFTRFVLTQFRRGCQEVHLIFDNPGRLQNTPKYFEHKRRDKSATITTDHCCDAITSTTKIPKRWRENLLHCRECKRSLVSFLTHYFMQNMNKSLQQNQTLYLAGGFDDPFADTCWFVQYTGKPQLDARYNSNAEETDTRLWVHVKQTEYTRILILSPDTDIYHIGLPLNRQSKQVVVQVSPINSNELKFLDICALHLALQNDPDLSGMAPNSLPQIIQTLFVCTGCDYISFFSGIGKATFLRYFFQYASFISGANSQGSLSDIEFQDDYKKGFLAFLRLVGTVYFKKHASGFDTPSPPTHFLQFAHADPSVQHKQWINDIRQNIADRTTFDTNMVPSTDALYLHWKRACWVLSMWGQADRNTMVLEPITENGWRLECTNLCVVWDTEENMQTVRERVCLLLKGCKCVTGCKNRVCGCKKKQSKCTEGCQCINCENQDSQEGESDELASVALEEELHSSGNVHLNEDEEDEFAEFVFAASCDTESETNIHID